MYAFFTFHPPCNRRKRRILPILQVDYMFTAFSPQAYPDMPTKTKSWICCEIYSFWLSLTVFDPFWIAFYSCLQLLTNFRPLLTVFEPFWIVSHSFSQCFTVFDCFWPFWLILTHVGHFFTVFECSWKFSTVFLLFSLNFYNLQSFSRCIFLIRSADSCVNFQATVSTRHAKFKFF